MKQVDFTNLEIQNFLSVGNEIVDIPFKRGLNVITGINHDKEDSNNGVGKTTIADAVFFALFGTTIRELKKEEIVNNINKKKCKVKIEFDITDNDVTNKYKVIREISPTKLTLEKNGEDETKSSMPKTTDEICRIIGATPDVFRNAVIMTINGTIPFMAQKKVEKRKFCEGLFNLGMFQEMLLTCRQKYNDCKNSLAIEETKVTEIENALNIYIDQRKTKEDYKTARIEKLLGREKDNLAELKSVKDAKHDISPSDATEFKKNIKLLETKTKTVKNDITKAIQRIATTEEQIKAKTQSGAKLKKFGDTCEECERPFTEDDKKKTDKKIAKLTKESTDLKTKITEDTKKRKELEALRDKCNKAIDKQKSNITDLSNSVQHNKNIKDRVDQLNTWNKQIKIDIKTLEDESGEFDSVIEDTQARLAAVKTTTDELEKKIKIYDSVKYIVSEEGVKSYIIKKLLKLLNGKLAYYLTKLDAPCRFKFNEYFAEQIINEKGDECSYNNFSSGEKKRIDLSILFTFMDIRRLQGNTSINLAFYDEILDTSLDDKGIQSFLEIVNERIEKYDESCYLISHKTKAVRAATADVIFLEKKNGFTTVSDFTVEDAFIRRL